MTWQISEMPPFSSFMVDQSTQFHDVIAWVFAESTYCSHCLKQVRALIGCPYSFKQRGIRIDRVVIMNNRVFRNLSGSRRVRHKPDSVLAMLTSIRGQLSIWD